MSQMQDHFSEQDVQSAIQTGMDYCHKTLNITPDHPDRDVMLWILSNGYLSRFARTNQLTDLRPAILYGQQAVDAVQPEDEERERGVIFNLLGICYSALFERTGQLYDLDQAIHYGQQALDFSFDGKDRAISLNNLAVAFSDRHDKCSHISDLDQSIRYHLEAVNTTPANDPRLPVYWNNLALVQRRRSWRSFEYWSDLDQAILSMQKALNLLQEGDPARLAFLNNLGLMFGERSYLRDQTSNLESAIKCGKEAVNGTSHDDPAYAKRSTNLGCRLKDLFRETQQIHHIDEAIFYARKAVDVTPHDSVDRLKYLCNLAKILKNRYKISNSISDLQGSTQAFEDGFRCTNSISLYRVWAGRDASKGLIREGNWEKAAQIVEECLRILPEVTPKTNSRDDLQDTVYKLSGLASFSASIFLKALKGSQKALKALEVGRGIIASLVMDTKHELSMLKENNPDLWSRYTGCQEEIAQANLMNDLRSEATSDQSSRERNEHLRRLYRNLDQLRNEIRQVSRAERSLLSPTEIEMLEMARNGPIVSLNISKISSEAFIITTTSIQALRLPDLKLQEVERCVLSFAARGNPSRRDASLLLEDEDEESSTWDPTVTLESELMSLWMAAVKPVLQQLNFSKREGPSKLLPRIWWVGGGLIALAPLHAAGDHSPGSTENTLSHVISSYAPTLKSLQMTQNVPSASSREQRHEVMVVSMPTTPGGYAPLKVNEEVKAIEEYAGSWASVTTLEHPCKIDVLRALGSCTMAHFACHGIADPLKPAQSALLIGKECEERLTINDLDTVTSQRARVVFLSACSTAELKQHSLVDESIHLASTFQLAGFQHVIGTLWSVEDSAAVEVTTKFYEGLLGYAEGDSLSIARALHDSVLSLRNSHRTDISRWAPFIHLGP